MTFADTLPLIWPLTFLAVALLVLRKVEDSVQPVVKEVMNGVAKNAQQYALMYAMAILYATAASLQALAEVATAFQWVYVAAFAKVMQPGTVAIIAYVTKPPAVSQVTADPPKQPSV